MDWMQEFILQNQSSKSQASARARGHCHLADADQHIPRGPREAMHLHHHILERVQEPSRILLADHQRWNQFDHVDMMTGDLRNDMMLLHQRNDRRLWKEALVHSVAQSPRGLQGERPRRSELDADHEPAPADFLDELKSRLHPAKSLTDP